MIHPRSQAPHTAMLSDEMNVDKVLSLFGAMFARVARKWKVLPLEKRSTR
jgi:hypothetical protein